MYLPTTNEEYTFQCIDVHSSRRITIPLHMLQHRDATVMCVYMYVRPGVVVPYAKVVTP